jgi:hypothetical protein
MYIPETSARTILIPVTGPDGLDLTTLPAQVAVIPDNGTEPSEDDYSEVSWHDATNLAFLIQPGSLAPGEYMAWAAITNGDETPIVLPSGRIRIGDAR